jgi:hypothetical protein
MVVGGRVTGIHWITDTRRVRVWIQIRTHERLWVRVWVEFCLAGMDSRTIYPCTTRPIAIPSHYCRPTFGRIDHLSHPVLKGKPNANHVRARISYSRTQQLHNMDIITQCSK